MYVRKKNNKSGKVSVQIIDKRNGKFKVYKTIGCSDDSLKVETFVKEGELFIKTYRGELEFDFEFGNDDIFAKRIYDSITKLYLLGPEIVLGKFFN